MGDTTAGCGAVGASIGTLVVVILEVASLVPVGTDASGFGEVGFATSLVPVMGVVALSTAKAIEVSRDVVTT